MSAREPSFPSRSGAPPGPRRRRLLRFLRWAGSALAASFLALAAAWHAFPFPASRLDSFPASERVVDRTGRVLRVYASSSGEFRFPVRLEEMSSWLGKATVAVEDRRFRSHIGVDPYAIARALLQNVSRGRTHSGASTIPQQLVRILDQRPRTLLSKAVEAFHALQLSSQLSKDAILEAYLNLAPYGGNLRGVEAASQRYFGKGAAALSLAEASLLAGLPQSPGRLRPDRHLARALARRAVVLDAMLREGFITQLERDEAARTVPVVRAHPWPFEAPHYSDVARQEAGSRPRSGNRDAGVIATCLDAAMQAAAERWLRSFFDADRSGRRELSGAAVVLDVETSAVLALAGSPDFADIARKGNVNAALRPRSPGSTLKPFLYALAFERGLAAPDSWLPDSARVYSTYSPENFEGDFLGPVPAKVALSLSRNAPAVYLAECLGMEALQGGLRRSGIAVAGGPGRTQGLALAVGACEAKLIDLANAYAMLARGGEQVPWRVLDRAEARAGERVVSAGSAQLVLEALSTEEHLRRAAPELASRWAGAVGYKTGTSTGLRDALAIAFSRRHVVSVWLGDPRGRPHPDLVGIRAAAPVALGLMAELERRPEPLFLRESGAVVRRPACSLTGRPPGKHCPAVVTGSAPAGAPALAPCDVHREILVDAASGLEVCGSCSGCRRVERRRVEVWPPESGIRGTLPPHEPACRAVALDARPRILSPADGGEYRLQDGARFEQKLVLAAVAHGAATVLHWFVDGVHFAAAPPAAKLPWLPTRGRHEVRCIDDRGRGAVVTIRVR